MTPLALLSGAAKLAPYIGTGISTITNLADALNYKEPTTPKDKQMYELHGTISRCF